MKYIRHILFLLLLTHVCYGQEKPRVSYLTAETWPQISNVKISDDGNIIMYNQHAETGMQNLYVKSLVGDWVKKINNAEDVQTACDSKIIVYRTNDSLVIRNIYFNVEEDIKDVDNYQLSLGSNPFISYQLKDSARNLFLENINTGLKKALRSVVNYRFCQGGNKLLYVSKSDSNPGKFYNLHLLDVETDRDLKIWEGMYMPVSFEFGGDDNRLFFISSGNELNKYDQEIWSYIEGEAAATVIINKYNSGLGTNFHVSDKDILKISRNQKWLFFYISKSNEKKDEGLSKKNSKLKIWKYSDTVLQSDLFKSSNSTQKPYLAAFDLKTHKIFRVEFDEDEVTISDGQFNPPFILTTTEGNADAETNSRLTVTPSICLVSLDDQSRKVILKGHRFWNQGLSPDRQYVLWFDRDKRDYFSYRIRTGVIKNISKHVKSYLISLEDKQPTPAPYPYLNSPCGWEEGDRNVFVYDHYDIWKLDPDGKRLPVNITNGYGHKHKIILRFAFDLTSPPLKKNQIIYLSAFDSNTKENGFYSLTYGAPADPVKLTMGPFIYEIPQISMATFDENFPEAPVKAKNANKYLVRRMGFNDYPNYFLTSDFKNFEQVTNLQPQARFNWLTADLIHWKLNSQERYEGILYKPEDFDPHKKYPVIFYYYELQSDILNSFLRPDLSNGLLNISYFVSNGYLVFVPDIHYKIGHPGNSIYNSVISGANYISKLTGVDSTKMAIMGHSFGGYETNLLLTRTNKFSAAVEAAGVCDLFSLYGSVMPGNGRSNARIPEYGQTRIGKNPWNNQGLYFQNSPIFYANRVNTPLLIMHNEGDTNVPWSQAFEWYTALRRLNKRVWMLDYDQEDHTLTKKINQLDFSVRLKQFLDYFLKNLAKPKWMNEASAGDQDTIIVKDDLSDTNQFINK